ncbi:MAG: hypothetical protein AB4290_05400 [Spirulina sp.]
MTSKVVITFPYSGYEANDARETIFWQIVEMARTVDDRPIVILNKDTENRERAKVFTQDKRSKENEKIVEIVRVWSVDTCQMWLAGWGYVIDNYESADRVVLLPGDIDTVMNGKRFFALLKTFIVAKAPDIAIGDFTSFTRDSSKELIDTYGTYALLANWFDEVSRAIQSLPLLKPRSEFLNIRISVLRKLLSYRKFAYEQTLNMLVRSWDFQQHNWIYDINIHLLGQLQDDKELRKYRDTLDQIERTERLLKLLWREVHEPQKPKREDYSSDAKYQEEIEKYNAKYKEFVDNYHMLDQQSTNIRDSARITIRSLLGA